MLQPEVLAGLTLLPALGREAAGLADVERFPGPLEQLLAGSVELDLDGNLAAPPTFSVTEPISVFLPFTIAYHLIVTVPPLGALKAKVDPPFFRIATVVAFLPVTASRI